MVVGNEEFFSDEDNRNSFSSRCVYCIDVE